MSQSKRRRPFVLTIVALASTTKLGCGSTAEDDDACKTAKANDACSTDGESCALEVSCASGEATVSVTCTSGYWRHAPSPCQHQADECEDHYRCSLGSWQFLGGGGNPPAPCPAAPPAEGSTCHPGAGFGADPADCGYPCSDGPGWSLVSCSSTTSTWSAGACDPSG